MDEEVDDDANARRNDTTLVALRCRAYWDAERVREEKRMFADDGVLCLLAFLVVKRRDTWL